MLQDYLQISGRLYIFCVCMMPIFKSVHFPSCCIFGYQQMYILVPDHNSRSNLFWVKLALLLVLAVFVEAFIYNLFHHEIREFFRYNFPSSSFPQTLHSRYSHPVNSVGAMIKSMQMGLVSGKNILTLSLSTSSSTCLMLASSPIPYCVMACSSSSLVMYLQLLFMLSRVNYIKPFSFCNRV